jgi:copper(I)-binding protein
MKRLLLLVLFASTPALAQMMQIDKPWARATAPGASVAGGYMVIRNAGTGPDRLLSASSPAAAKVELHLSTNDNGVMKMRQVPGYDVPAKGAFELKPGGAHLMFMDIKRQFKEGDKLPVKLKFEKSGEVTVDFVVGGMGAAMAPMDHHMHKN